MAISLYLFQELSPGHKLFSIDVNKNNGAVASKKIIDAQRCINSAPELPNGYINLAAAFLDQKKYNEAIDSLKKALTLCSNDEERYLVYYNLSVIYMNQKKWQNALEVTNKAKSIKDSADIDGLSAMISYNMGNKEQAKKSYIELLQKYPDDIIATSNLATIYIKQLNLVQAGKTLNNLIKINPDAKNDPKIKKYGILIFLFK